MESRDHKNGAKPKSHTSRKIKYQIYMEKIKKIMAVVGIIAIAAVMLGFVTNPPANAGNEKILTVRTFESFTAAIGSTITIVDENGKLEVIELDRLSKKTASTNLIKINSTLNSVTEKGYQLAFTAGGGDQFTIYTTYTFVKK